MSKLNNFKMVNLKNSCGCGGNIDLHNFPKGTIVNIYPQTPAELILKVILCLASFILISLFCIKALNLSPLLSAIFGVILSLCFGGCFSFIIKKLDSLFKIY